MNITLKPIGIVKTQATEQETKTASDELKSELEIYPKFEAALDGIDSDSHLFGLGYFHKLRPEQIGRLQVKPRRMLDRRFSWRNSLYWECLP